MIEISLVEIAGRALNALLTIYMMLILLRWFASWLQLDVFNRWLRWAWRLTDPLINAMRRMLPPMGPIDFAPLAALFAVFFVRLIVLQMF